jgi:hypothetical protein
MEPGWTLVTGETPDIQAVSGRSHAKKQKEHENPMKQMSSVNCRRVALND